MKGFKATGYGPTSGFKFPARMGFTGSTGGVTNVSSYVRRKHFADGGYVRQDNPRMKSEVVGDSGSAVVRRTKASSSLDEQYGGKTPLRPGFKNGGKAEGGAVASKRAAPRPRGTGQITEFEGRQPIGSRQAPKKAAPGFAVKSKFYNDGGKVKKAMGGAAFGRLGRQAMERARQQQAPSAQLGASELLRRLRGARFADGGKATKPEYPKPSYLDAVIDRVKEMVTSEAESSTGLAKKAADKVSGRRKQIDDAVDDAVSGRKGYSRGGRSRRC